MAVDEQAYKKLTEELAQKNVALIAVSKTKPAEDVLALYNLGQKDFGENYAQEMAEKQSILPQDIRWHFIGHLQSNKVKYIASFVHLIHSVDSLKLLMEINKQAIRNNRIIDCLLQVHIAKEETKFGFNEEELNEAIKEFENMKMKNVRIKGLMGMASFTDDMTKVRSEFTYLRSLFDKYGQWSILSMGMTADYQIAIEQGSTMVRIGSLLFGAR